MKREAWKKIHRTKPVQEWGSTANMPRESQDGNLQQFLSTPYSTRTHSLIHLLRIDFFPVIRAQHLIVESDALPRLLFFFPVRVSSPLPLADVPGSRPNRCSCNARLQRHVAA